MTTTESAHTPAGVAWDEFLVYDQIGFQPHAGQIPILRAKARNKVVVAGRRAGKSFVGGNKLVPEAIRAYSQRNQLSNAGIRHEYWIVGPEYSDAEKEFRVLYDSLVRLRVPFDRPGTYNDPLGGSMHISLWEGRYQVHAKSARHPETLVGEGLSGVVMSEAAKIRERVWTKFIRPTLADFSGWSLFSTTPEGKNWIYKLYQQGKDPARPDWWSFRAPSWINPSVFRGLTVEEDVKFALEEKSHDRPIPGGLRIDPEILAMLGDLTPEMFNQEVAALFTEFVGRVFKEFDDEVHVASLTFNPSWRTYAAVDYGFTNPFVWLLIQEGPFGQLHVLDEIHQSGLTIVDAASLIQSRNLAPAGMTTFYADPAGPGETRELSELLKVHGTTAGTGGNIQDRIEAIRKALRPVLPDQSMNHPDNFPLLMFDRRCVETIREFNDYRYPKSSEEASRDGSNNIPENPLKKDDHAPEALGRFFAGHYGPRSNETSAATVRHANMGIRVPKPNRQRVR